MSRTLTVADSLDTHAAGWIHHVLIREEEHRPLPEDPSPGMLVARVSERLCQALAAIDDLKQAAVYLFGAAGFALTAIVHIDPDTASFAPTEGKNCLLEQLDRDALAMVERDGDFVDRASPFEFVNCSLVLLTEAYQAVVEMEGVNAFPLECDRDSERAENWEEYVLGQIVEALYKAAVVCAVGGEQLIIPREASTSPAAS